MWFWLGPVLAWASLTIVTSVILAGVVLAERGRSLLERRARELDT